MGSELWAENQGTWVCHYTLGRLRQAGRSETTSRRKEKGRERGRERKEKNCIKRSNICEPKGRQDCSCVKAPATKPNNPSLIPGTPREEEENQFQQLSSDLPIHGLAGTYANT